MKIFRKTPIMLYSIFDIDDFGGGGNEDLGHTDDLDLDIDGNGHIDTSLTDGSDHGIISFLKSDGITFTSREDMLPYEQIFNEDSISSLYGDPFGVYSVANSHTHGLFIDDFIPKPEFGSEITDADLQNLGNEVFDALHLRHIPIMISSAVPNAAYSPGFIPRLSFDDGIFINPDYANMCIDELSSSDIVISDLAHEIGHYLTNMYGGPNDTFTSEKIADFVSGFINAKMGVDIDVARKWFQLFYDPNGEGGYPVSEERWDIEAAGYHFANHATCDDLLKALKDDHFIEMIKGYNSSSSEQLASIERLNLIQSKDFQAKEIFRAVSINDDNAKHTLVKFIKSLKNS